MRCSKDIDNRQTLRSRLSPFHRPWMEHPARESASRSDWAIERPLDVLPIPLRAKRSENAWTNSSCSPPTLQNSAARKFDCQSAGAIGHRFDSYDLALRG